MPPLLYSLLPLLLCMTVVTWQAFGLDPHSNGRDFMHNGWIAGRLILEGQNPYNPNQQEVQRLAGSYLSTLIVDGSIGYNTGAAYNAVYPYWALLLQTPLGLLDFPLAFIIWTLLSGALLLTGLYVVLEGARRRLTMTPSPLVWSATLLGFGLAALVFVPTLLHFSLGQYSVIIFFLLGLLFLPAGGMLLAVSAFALATMKPQLSALPLAILLLGWLLLARRKAILSIVLTAALYLIPALFVPYAFSGWFSVNFLVQKQSTRLAPASSSWWGLAYAWAGHWWVWVAGALSLLTIALLIRPVQRAIAARDVTAVLPLAIIVTLMITPYTLGYDQVLLLLPFAWLWLRLQNDARLAARLLRYALLLWLTLLPLLQVELVDMVQSNYIRVIQTLALLILYYAVTKLKANPAGVMSDE